MLEKKKKGGKLIPILISSLVIAGIGLMLYKPLMTHFFIPQAHSKISDDAKQTAPSEYGKNQQLSDDALKDFYKKHGIKYDPKNFSSQMDDDAFKNSFTGGFDSSKYFGDSKKKGFGSGNHKGAPDLSFDYGRVKAPGSTDLSSINPRYDRRLLTGHIAIPAIGINMPVLQGVSNANLYAGAGTLKPFQQMGKGNYALASHHMPDQYSNFSRIGQLHKGNRILLSNGKKVFEYRTSSVKQMPTRSSSVVNDEAGKKEVTLVTCVNTYGTSDQNGNARVVVKGDLVKSHGMGSQFGKYFK